MSVVHDRILATDEALACIEQYLIAICFQPELGKAQHAVARRWPYTALLLDNLLMRRRQGLQWTEFMDKEMLFPELNDASHQPEPTSALQELFVGLWKRHSDFRLDSRNLLLRRTWKNVFHIEPWREFCELWK